MASVRQIQVTFDCAEPERVARFWSEVLGYALPPESDRDPDGAASACTDPSGVGPRLYFQRVPEAVRLVALGATRLQLLVADGVNESCQVMQDVEGNEFCLE